MNPARVPQAGPRIGAVRAVDIILAKVITAAVPRTGYAGNNTKINTIELQIAVKATKTEVLTYFWTIRLNHPLSTVSWLLSFCMTLIKLAGKPIKRQSSFAIDANECSSAETS